MTYRIRLAAAVAATLSATLLATPPAHAAPKMGGYDCVDTYDWSHLQTDLDGPNGGARRSVIEEAWRVIPVGYRNQYWVPANHNYYSLAYNFCQNPRVLIVMIYRKSSGAWQMALKGEFLPM